MSAMDCIEIVRKAGGNLTDDEVTQIYEDMQRTRSRLIAEGKIDGLDRRMMQAARDSGDKVRLAAALQRKHAALNAVVRDKLETAIAAYVSAGLSHRRAVLTVLEGANLTSSHVAKGRVSVAATKLAYESRYVGDMMARVVSERPHIEQMLEDQSFADAIVREMYELRDGGKPGVTGNADAQFMAQTFATFGELSRLDLNRLGATIGKLDGWSGPQSHDPFKLLDVTEDEWIDAILLRLDHDRTFGRDGAALDLVRGAHRGVTADKALADKNLREILRAADDLDRRIGTLEGRKQDLNRRAEVARAELGTLGGERADTIDRYVTNLEREQDGRIRMQVEGRDDAADRHSIRRKEAARENAAADTRLQGKSDRARRLTDRIEGRFIETQQAHARLSERRAALHKQAQDLTAKRDELNKRLIELEAEGGGLRDAIDDPREFLRQAYKSITTGRDNTITAAQKGEVTGPANLAKSLAKHRVLHFKSADDYIAYNRQFGHGNVVTSMIAHQKRAAMLAAQMEILGPNPEVMMKSLLDSLQQRVRNDPNIPGDKKAGLIRSLTLGHGNGIGSSFAEVRGLTLAPENVTFAKISSGLRAWQSMSKLGGAVISSISDLPTGAANLTFHGKPLGQAWADQFGELLHGRGDKDRRELAYLTGEGFDGMVGHILTEHTAGDGMPGVMSKAMETFFRFSGLTWWTDTMRASAGRIFSAYVGSNADTAFAALDDRFRHGLGLHGIGEAEWDTLRQANFRADNGKVYVTGDRIRDLPDDVVQKLVPAADIATARKAFKVDETTMKQFDRDIPVPADLRAEREAKFTAWLGRRTETARTDLEMTVRRYIADEVNYAMMEPDESTRRVTLWGTRSGTVPGEALRFIAQFKGFPATFTQRVLGRALFGGRGDTVGQRLMNNKGHIAHLIVGMGAAGYMAMTIKDTLRGWDARDPKDLKTWMAAFAQGGGAGIYGDFLFGQANRFGNKILETVAGPAIGAGASGGNLLMKLRDGDAKAADAFNLALQNTPFVNLFYTRPALDYLVLNSLHETMSPGYLRRQERQRYKDYHQERLWK